MILILFIFIVFFITLPCGGGGSIYYKPKTPYVDLEGLWVYESVEIYGSSAVFENKNGYCRWVGKECVGTRFIKIKDIPKHIDKLYKRIEELRELYNTISHNISPEYSFSLKQDIEVYERNIIRLDEILKNYKQ